MREQVTAEIAGIEPFDALEAEHRADALAWVASGAQIFRVSKPAVPPKHLVSYFVLVDGESVLLVDHRNAQLWLPTGGHVEPGEHPRTTVRREIREELGIDAPPEIGAPLLITSSRTVGLTAGHTDVSLWYAIAGDRHQQVRFDSDEFDSVRWFPFSEVPFAHSDPHMERFIGKLQSARRRG
jgi:8-oxo-dGTP diphosphatase